MADSIYWQLWQIGQFSVFSASWYAELNFCIKGETRACLIEERKLTMPRKVAPSKLTGNNGIVFEGKVGAYFLVVMLTGNTYFNYDEFGFLTEVSFQHQADHWINDDLLLTFDNQGQTIKVALSIKSNQQITSKGKPSTDFIRDAWEQYLGVLNPNPFDPDHDIIGLVTAPIQASIKTKLTDQLSKAKHEHASVLDERIDVANWVSKDERELYYSFACPDDLASKFNVGTEKIGELLKRLAFLDFDFDLQMSRDESHAIGLCRQALASGDMTEAGHLWSKIQEIANDYRPKAGQINLIKLISIVKKSFRLKHYPHHKPDWEKLNRNSKRNIDTIPGKIAGQVVLERTLAMAHIDSKVQKGNILVLLGASGCGKTVLAKNWASNKIDISYSIIWWSFSDYRDGLTALEHRLNLNCNISKLCHANTSQSATMIFDGLDRCFSDSEFQTAVALLRTTLDNENETPWSAIITSRLDEWNRVWHRLNVNGIPERAHEYINPIIVEFPDNDELEPVWNTFPSLSMLRTKPHLRPIVSNLKYLDLLARNSQKVSMASEQWTSESDVIDWLWKEDIVQHHSATARGSILKMLAERQADALEPETSSDFLNSTEQGLIGGLIRDGIIKERDERYSFNHDLWGDWARLRLLLSHAHELPMYLAERITSPLWHRAVRLYGQRLLEKSSDLDQWIDSMNVFSSKDSRASVEQDLLLEASLHVNNPLKNLAKLWPVLIDNQAQWLERLLGRFLVVAGYPDPRSNWLKGKIEPDQFIFLLSVYRIPIISLWHPVVDLLCEHLDEAIHLIPGKLAELCQMGLPVLPKGTTIRKKLAKIAVAGAEYRLAWTMADGIRYSDSDEDKSVYSAAMLAASDSPSRVKDFALIAVGRKEPSGRIEQLIEIFNRDSNTPRPTKSPSYNKELAARLTETSIPVTQLPAWPDGPIRKPGHIFKNVCLQNNLFPNVLLPLIKSQPKAAKELILALLIEAPKSKSIYYETHWHIEKLGLSYFHRDLPPLYTKGPFWAFLINQPKEGLDLIITLVEFVTERWAEHYKKQRKDPPSILIPWPDGDRLYFGDERVLYWHRVSLGVPDIVCSALMALERWLYDQIDDAKDSSVVLPVITRLSQRTKSLAFIGLLISLGKRHPELFISLLKPLLAVLELHSWDLTHVTVNERNQLIGWWGKTEAEFNLASEWHSYKHRKIELRRILIYLFIQQNSELMPFFNKVRDSWLDYLGQKDNQDNLHRFVEIMCAQLDLSNWTSVLGEEDEEYYEFQPSQSLQETWSLEDEQTDLDNLRMQIVVESNQRLEQNRPLTSEELEIWWQNLQNIASLPKDQEDYFGKKDALTGGMAVLLTFHQDWVNADASRKTWCDGLIAELFVEPCQKQFQTVPEWGTDLSWDSFMANIVPIYLAERTNDTHWLQWVFKLLLSHTYKSIAILFASAFHVRSKLGLLWPKMLRQMIRLAVYRGFNRYVNTNRGQVNESAIELWLENEWKAFCFPGFTNHTNTTVKKPCDIVNEISEVSNTFNNSMPTADHSDKFYLNYEMIRAAVGWLPSLSTAIDEIERHDWIELYRGLLSLSLNNFSHELERERDPIPSEWDIWAMGKVGHALAQFKSEENPKEFWQPILDLCAPGHLWIDSFFSSFFIEGLEQAPASSSFIMIWQSMLNYIFNLKCWNTKNTWWSQGFDENWKSIIGLNFTFMINTLWRVEHETLVTLMEDFYKSWTENSLNIPSCALAFIDFLSTEAAINMRLKAIIWLEQAIDIECGGSHYEKPLEDALISLLTNIWESQKASVCKDDKIKSVFLSLLNLLVERQRPEALELQRMLLN